MQKNCARAASAQEVGSLRLAESAAHSYLPWERSSRRYAIPSPLDRLKAALSGQYAIVRELGRGGMATVYLAHDLRHERLVAVKVLHPELAATLGTERFLQEIKTTANLQHPNILPLFDSGAVYRPPDGSVDRVIVGPEGDRSGDPSIPRSPEFLYYVMPYVDGESLRDRLGRERQLPLDDALLIAREVGDALSYAHSHGVIHRDIKPENILLESGHAVVADFGIARAVSAGGGDRLTLTGFAVGTPAYMSPEQASGDQQLDARSDVYSLGCVVYEMLTGEPPHTGATPQAILARQLTGEVRPIRPIRSTVSAGLEGAVRQCLAPSPADRFPTATAFVEALQRRQAGPRRSSAVLSLVVSRRTLRTVLGTVAVMAVAAVLGLIGRSLLRVRAARAGERPATVAVFPFRALGPEAGSLGEGVADLLSATLDGTVGVVVADPGGLWRSLRRADGPLRVPELDEAAEIARRTGAPSIVLGSLTAVGGRLDLSTRVYGADGQLRSTLTASAPADSLPALVNRMAIDVVAAVWERDTLPTVPVIERFTTRSVDALQAYLDAKRLKRLGRYDEAEAALTRSVTLDSTFALAQMELFDVRSTVLYLNAQPFVGLTEIIDRAMRYRDRLSPRNRLRVEALRAMDETDGLRAATLIDRILEIDSLDVEALHERALAYVGYGWQMEKTEEDVVAAYRRVADVDSSSVMAELMLAWLAELREDRDGIARAVGRLRALDTSGAFAQGRLSALRALEAPAGQRERMLTRIAALPAPAVFTALRDLRQLRPALAEQLVAILLADTMPVFHQRIGEGARAQLWVAEGRTAGVDSLVKLGQLDPVRQRVNRMLVGAFLLGVGDSTSAFRAASELAAYAPRESLAAYLDTHEEAWAAAWAVGAYQAAEGDTAEARAWQRAIAALPPGDTPWDWTASLAADIEARLAARRGDVEAAELEAQRAYDAWRIHSGYASGADPEPAMRFHLAAILRARGAPERAAGLFQSFGEPHTWMGFFTPRAALELAEIRERQGRREEALQYYRAAERLWSLGDPATVGPWLSRARDGLRRLGAG